MKKIAVPVKGHILSSHFRRCDKFYLYDINDGKIVRETTLTPPPHEPGLLPKWLHRHLVTDILVGGSGRRAIHHFNHLGINVFAGAPKMPPEELVDSHLNGSLILSENYCDH